MQFLSYTGGEDEPRSQDNYFDECFKNVACRYSSVYTSSVSIPLLSDQIVWKYSCILCFRERGI